jgi:predicted ATPase
MREGLEVFRATGAHTGVPLRLAALADAYGSVGQIEEGLILLAEAQALIDNSGARASEAEVYRLRGEVLLARSAEHGAEAETCFRQALDVARHQQAKSWELRAAMSLSRLWQQQGKREAARELLAPIYGWFTEGFDTADLQEAKAFLETLG